MVTRFFRWFRYALRAPRCPVCCAVKGKGLNCQACDDYAAEDQAYSI